MAKAPKAIGAIMCPDRFDRQAALRLLPEIQAAAATGTIRIDARNVTQIGQAGLQLLLSTMRTVPSATLMGSEKVRDTARLAGLAATLFGENAA